MNDERWVFNSSFIIHNLQFIIHFMLIQALVLRMDAPEVLL